MNSIIFYYLCGGIGSRFKDVYALNKPDIYIYGEKMYKLVLNNFFQSTKNIDYKLYITVNKNIQGEFIFYDIKKEYIENNIADNPILLDYNTRGPIETAKLSLNNSFMNNKEQTIWFLDNDIIYSPNINWDINLDKNELCVLIEKLPDNLQLNYIKNSYSPYSHVIIHDGYIIDIVEKVFISEYIVIGAYGFGSSILFNSLFDIFNNKNKNSEWFMSLLIKLAIENNIKVKYILSENNINVGTPTDININIKNNNIILSKKRWVFDLDNTLVTYPTNIFDYNTVKPIEDMINFVNYLYDNENYIIIHTARNMKTKNKKYINIETKKIIIDTLKKFNIKYHELILEKPYADFYVDDKSINPLHLQYKQWKTNAIGFGYDNIIYDKQKIHNKVYIINEGTRRAEVLAAEGICYKLCSYYEILGYEFFIKNINENILQFIPKFYDIKVLDNGFYKLIMEYKKDTISISHLYCNNVLNDNIFDKIINLLKILHNTKLNDINEEKIDYYCKLNYVPKLLYRIEQYDIYKQLNINIDIIKDFFNEYKSTITNVIHGDFWFNNLLWEEKENKIYMIDMRGLLGDYPCLSGDKFYDYAKLYQSICGFDHILHNEKKIDTCTYNKYKYMFINALNLSLEDYYKIKKITAFLMLGSLPYHNINENNNKFKLIISLINQNWNNICNIKDN